MKLKTGQAYYIEWKDSCGPEKNHWKDIDEVEIKSCLCRSLGWIKAQSESAIVIVGQTAHVLMEEGLHAMSEMTIVKSTIKKAVKLRDVPELSKHEK